MTVFQLINNLFTEDTTVPLSSFAYAGLINVSSGFAEFRSSHFQECARCNESVETIRNCDFCGRGSANNIQFPVKKGQVAAGASLYDGLKLIGSIFVFDDHNSLAASVDNDLHGGSLKEIGFSNTFQENFIDSLSQYVHLTCLEVGSFTASYSTVADVGFVAGDSHSGLEPYATVDHPFANGDFKLYLFSEVLGAQTGHASEVSAFLSERGYGPSVRPRVALALNSDYEGHVLKNIQPRKQDSAQLTFPMVDDVVSEPELPQNGAMANLLNGVFWSYAAYDQAHFYRGSPGSGDIWYLYTTRALGYLVQGALGGSGECLSLAREHVEVWPQLLDEPSLIECLKPRGVEDIQSIRKMLNG